MGVRTPFPKNTSRDPLFTFHEIIMKFSKKVQNKCEIKLREFQDYIKYRKNLITKKISLLWNMGKTCLKRRQIKGQLKKTKNTSETIVGQHQNNLYNDKYTQASVRMTSVKVSLSKFFLTH